MINAGAAPRLADLLISPREAPNVELKGWLDIGNAEHQATLAKAMLAIANHGGGFILIGWTEVGADAVEAADRPASLADYNQDRVNGIVRSYADPAFHCSVEHVPAPDGRLFPVIIVPGGHRVPIRSRRAGPNNATVQMNTIYIRRPGPSSESPQTAQDWDDLFSRCLAARRDEMLDRIRDLLSGSAGGTPSPEAVDRLETWTRSCTDRWVELTADLPREDPRRCPHGYYWLAYEISGNRRPITLAQLPDVLRRSVVRYTGWPPFFLPHREGIAPYPVAGLVECWLSGDMEN